MFRALRYGLVPVVMFCLMTISASVAVQSENAGRKSSWVRTSATVLQVSDAGRSAPDASGLEKALSNPYGTVSYVANGRSFTWRGHAREIGLASMRAGEEIQVYYNPQNPRQMSTLVLLGQTLGNAMCAAAAAFLMFYLWYFWLRGWFRRPRPEPVATRPFLTVGLPPERIARKAGGSFIAPAGLPAGGASSLRRSTVPPRRTFGKR